MTGHGEDAGIEALGRLTFANVLDFAIVRPDGVLEVDLARLERDRASAIREVTLIEKTDPSGGTTRITRLTRLSPSCLPAFDHVITKQLRIAYICHS